MTASLHQIVYISRATAPLSDDTAAALCRSAAERNRGARFTGLLLRGFVPR
ncbi:hypothetical protein [Sphingomonas phyllosphaerae]|uniref:hypothetical protein n=1 Tax=Sphingomonas phyllosphaerae TaxID=257003 RepID=UPI00241364F9|nr:hypothetical protein [Sphingomonas phyllosphaerae]